VVSIFCGQVESGQQPLVYGDGRQTRDYVYVGDVVDAFLAAADAARPGTWNIGTGCETSVLELVRLIGQAAGHVPRPQYAPPRPGELKRSGLDITRASHDLGWKATTPSTKAPPHITGSKPANPAAPTANSAGSFLAVNQSAKSTAGRARCRAARISGCLVPAP
jgi:GDP-mannose 4,6 dehydratase